MLTQLGVNIRMPHHFIHPLAGVDTRIGPEAAEVGDALQGHACEHERAAQT